MQLNEAEIQLLASVYRAESEDSATDQATLEAGGERFGEFREDWIEASEDHLPEIEAGTIARHLYIARKST